MSRSCAPQVAHWPWEKAIWRRVRHTLVGTSPGIFRVNLDFCRDTRVLPGVGLVSSSSWPPAFQRLSLSPAPCGGKLSARSLQRLSVEQPSSPTTQPFPARRSKSTLRELLREFTRPLRLARHTPHPPRALGPWEDLWPRRPELWSSNIGRPTRPSSERVRRGSRTGPAAVPWTQKLAPAEHSRLDPRPWSPRRALGQP